MADIQLDENNTIIRCEGSWTLRNLAPLELKLNKLKLPADSKIIIDGQNLKAIDSAGAWLIQTIILNAKTINTEIRTKNFSEVHNNMLKLAISESENVTEETIKPEKHNILYKIGKTFTLKTLESFRYLSFVGYLSQLFLKFISKPRAWHLKSISAAVEDAGFYALPIIALLSFLIGVVLAYQLGLQLQKYAASAYIVMLSGTAILREFGPLITAIIVAGRTTSSYTARLGLMKVNEEMDALFAMGLSPVHRLALPRLLGVIIAIPLLTIWADAFGVLGSMFMSESMLDIRFSDFLSRFDEDVDVDSLWVGLSKTPVFALLVASVGCYQGFQVSYSAESIGRKTTVSVVQAIFLVIIADAYFSVLFSWAGI